MAGLVPAIAFSAAAPVAQRRNMQILRQLIWESKQIHQGEKTMRFNALLASTSLVSALACLTLSPLQAQTAAALSGQVSSAEEGAMEGVLVSAKRDGSTITTTVVSNDKGQYSFPADRLPPRPPTTHHPRPGRHT